MRGDVKLLYVAPERFDFGTTAERLRDAGVSLLAVDEAHCISEWGHDFRPSYLRIAQVREKLGWPPTVALTATATPHVRTDIVAQLKLDAPTTIITGFDRDESVLHVLPDANDADKDDALVHLLRDAPTASPSSTPRRARPSSASRLLLDRARIPAAAYHAGLDDERRHDVQDAFMTEKVRAIVATNAFGMGIDKPNVRLVMHYAMPGTLEAYYQEAGRAGPRWAARARAILLHAFPDRFTHEFFIKGAYPERALVEEVYDVLQRERRLRVAASTSSPEDIASRHQDQGRRARRRVGTAHSHAGRRVHASMQEGGARVLVRLLATPERIKRELGDERDSLELGILRAMWRVAGDALNDGAPIDLDGLPPGFGGGSGSDATARCARSRASSWSGSGSAPAPRSPAPRKPLTAFRDRLGDDRSAPESRSAKARRHAAVRIHARVAAAASCFATSATRRRARPAMAATTASARASRSRRAPRHRRGAPAPRNKPRRDVDAAPQRIASAADDAPSSPAPTKRCSLGCAICAAPSRKRSRFRRTSFFRSHARRNGRSDARRTERRTGRDPRRWTREDREVRRTFSRCPARRRRNRSRLGDFIQTYDLMDDSLYFSEQHLATREMVRQFARDEVAPVAAKHDADAKFPWENIRKMGELGSPRRAVARRARRRRTRLISFMIVIHELAKVDASHGLTISAHTTLGTSPIVKFGTDEQQRAIRAAPRAADASWAASASPSRKPGSDAGGTRTTAVRKNDRYVLNGTKRFITHGSVGEIFVVTAVTDPSTGNEGNQLVHSHQADERSRDAAKAVGVGHEPSLAAMPGFRAGKKEDKLGWRASDTAELIMEDVEVPAENLLGEEGAGLREFHADARQRPHRHRRAVARHRRRRVRAGAAVHEHVRKQFGQADRALPGRAVPARPTWRRRSRPAST